MRGLKDKIAIVAGAAPGNIGGATAIRLAEEGMLVVAADLHQAAAQTVVDGITASGGTALARGFDITDEGSYRDLVTFTVERREPSGGTPTSPRCRSTSGSTPSMSTSPATCTASGTPCRS
jgi:NAD(P)-dependent dehydrogenase (short-subunit alcohol dehydrogenase family)